MVSSSLELLPLGVPACCPPVGLYGPPSRTREGGASDIRRSPGRGRRTSHARQALAANHVAPAEHAPVHEPPGHVRVERRAAVWVEIRALPRDDHRVGEPPPPEHFRHLAELAEQRELREQEPVW